MRTWDDEKSVIYLLILLVRHGQNNYFFGLTKLEEIRYIQEADYIKANFLLWCIYKLTESFLFINYYKIFSIAKLFQVGYTGFKKIAQFYNHSLDITILCCFLVSLFNTAEPAFTCSKSKIETPKRCLKSVQS